MNIANKTELGSLFISFSIGILLVIAILGTFAYSFYHAMEWVEGQSVAPEDYKTVTRYVNEYPELRNNNIVKDALEDGKIVSFELYSITQEYESMVKADEISKIKKQ